MKERCGYQKEMKERCEEETNIIEMEWGEGGRRGKEIMKENDGKVRKGDRTEKRGMKETAV